jgi:glutaredoxin
VKEFLSRRGYEFEEKDIRQDPGAVRELVDVLQSRVTPTLVVEGKVMLGFDPQVLESWLESGSTQQSQP